MNKIFLIINKGEHLQEMKKLLAQAGYEAVSGKVKGSLKDQMELYNPDAAVIDQELVEAEGEQLQKLFPDKPVIAFMDRRDAKRAVELISEGAFDVIFPPLKKEEVEGVVGHALRKSAAKREEASGAALLLRKSLPYAVYGVATAAAVAAVLLLKSVITPPGIAEFDLNYQNPTSVYCSENYVWTSDWYTQNIYQYKAGRELELARSMHFQSLNPYSAAVISGQLWVADAAGKVETYELLEKEHVLRNMFRSPGRSLSGFCVRDGSIWSVDAETRMIYQHELQNFERITAQYPYPGVMPVGLYWDGKYFWSADGKTGKIYKHRGPENQFEIISAYMIEPEESGKTGAAWQLSGLSGDGKNLWIVFSGKPAKLVRYPLKKLL